MSAHPSSPRRSHLALLVVVVAALVAAACGSDDGEIATGAGDDAGGAATRPWIAGDWALMSAMAVDGPLTLPNGVPLELTITGPDSVRGTAGCNTFDGLISAPFDGDDDAGPLTITDLAATEMACDHLDFESTYLALLTAVTEWELSPPSNLVFRGDGIELVYGIAEPPADVPLEGTAWMFDTVFAGEGVDRTASTPRADKPTVTAMLDGGVLTLSADDCGPIEVSVDYEATAGDGPFAVSGPEAPTVECDDADSNLYPALAGVVEASGFQVVDGRLTLIGPAGETVSFRASDG